MAFGTVFLLQDFSQVHLRLSENVTVTVTKVCEYSVSESESLLAKNLGKRQKKLSPCHSASRPSTLRSRCWTSPEEKRYTRKGAAHFTCQVFDPPLLAVLHFLAIMTHFFFLSCSRLRCSVTGWRLSGMVCGVCHEWHRSLGRVELLSTS